MSIQPRPETMTMAAKEGLWALTEKEKQTLRLIVRGHDAKSTARSLGLSVHTINERLRDARRKLAVSSSREAARLLLEAERIDPAASDPEYPGDTALGDDAGAPVADQETAPAIGARRGAGRPILLGVLLMTLLLGLLALAAVPQADPAAAPAPTETAAVRPEVRDAALQFLALVDRNDWDASYRATGAAFRKLNTAATWAKVSKQVRAQFGPMVSRTLVSEEDLPAPPHGYEVLKFRTSFANKADTVETVSLNREGGAWRVVGITIG